MADIRVDKVLVGTPTYKVVVGDFTRVLKIEVGSPTRNVLISNAVNLNDVIGIDVTNPTLGDLLVYDSTNRFVNAKVLDQNQVIDGKIYEQDSDRGFILIRRSPTTGQPILLRAGELAYSFLPDSGSAVDGTGNGGDRLYIGYGSDQTEFASRIDLIGGKYFTDLLDHKHGILTASSGVIVDANKRINEFNVDNLNATNLNVTVGSILNSATITDLSVVNIDSVDLVRNTFGVLNAGAGINITTDDSSITISGLTASVDSAGIVSFDSSTFEIIDGKVFLVQVTGGGF